MTSINLTECENILKEHYHIDPDLNLIILKYFKEDQTFQYELYSPITHEKLNLSLCENIKTEVFVSLEMDEKTEEIYNNLKEQGYDPLDLNDKFYREICTPYTSENGTDVLLDDREEFIYSSLVNDSLCPSGCNYSEYILEKKYIKCECDTNTTGIETLDLEHLTGKNIGNSFLSTLKTTNWKVMICYNLVFNFKIFCHNYGSILILILFVVYIIFMLYYCVKDINPLKVEISKILFISAEEEEQETKIKYDEKKMEEKMKENEPPKKVNQKANNKNKNNFEENLKTTEDNALIVTNRKNTKRRSTKKTTLASKSGRKNSRNNFIYKNPKNKDDIKKIEQDKKRRNLDNFELNNLDYAEACLYDKRSCCQTYLSVLMREHIALSTFVSCKDYNLFYVKFEKFLIIFCVDMTMNGLFFVHDSMHRKYTENENFTFVQKLPQLLFTLIVAHILEVILCFLSMTDTQVYKIKELFLYKKEKENMKGEKGEKVIDILDCMKRKLITFFCFTFILFLFFWYFISAFCAVYQNTQKIFLRDSMISFATSLIDPFFIYGFTSLLRRVSLTRLCRRNCCCGCVFKISDIIPIF